MYTKLRTNMIIFLKKVRVKTVFSAFQPIIVEPLELCYLETVLKSMNVENYIVDELFSLNEPSVIPDVVVLTGYNVAENKIISEARFYKTKYPHVKVIVGGVHVQGNVGVFNTEGIDYVCHIHSLYTFRMLIENIMNGNENFIDGVNSSDKVTLYEKEHLLPDRSLFKQFSNKLRYLEKKNVALIKGSIGCPYSCSYCYCKLINNSHYVKANYEKMISEIEDIAADYFWIVDDVLFADRNDALEFIEIVKRKNLNLNIIGYLRADFILKEKDLLPALRKAGLVEVIVGFEATSNDELKGYDKTTNALDYPEVISLLKTNKIDLTALFMVQPEYEIKDFRNLYKFIKKNNIDVYTISILTPIKGTKDYELLKNKLLTHDPRKFDFLHLVLKSKLPKWLFYLLFYGVHVQLLKSRRVWKFILSNKENL